MKIEIELEVALRGNCPACGNLVDFLRGEDVWPVKNVVDHSVNGAPLQTWCPSCGETIEITIILND